MIIKPTQSDYITAHLIADRILLRKMFEELRDRSESKYFKNIVIEDVEWNYKKLNAPESFFNKYPYDFKVSFTTLGCNMLKCYYSNKPNPTLINGYLFGNSEACFGIYKEFNDYLINKFNLGIINNDDSTTFPFETLSIELSNKDTICGTQLTELKKFAILPSSRWSKDDDNDDDKSHRTRISERAGLVDAPPLTWNTEKQNIKFNYQYCQRFIKDYNKKDDYCYDRIHRKVLKYLFGQNIVNFFPDLDQIILNGGHLPIQYIHDYIWGNDLEVNRGYKEYDIDQNELERNVFVEIPDKKVNEKNVEIINFSSSSNFNYLTKKSLELESIIIDILRDTGIDLTIESAATTVPAITARLLKHYSSQIIEKALNASSSLLPVSIRIGSLMARTIILDVMIKTAIRVLSFAASTMNVFLAITLVTLIPDVLLTYYNIGGFNNEIQREDIESRRKMILNIILRNLIKNYENLLNYVVLEDYITPIITPETVYYLSLINFLQKNPELKIAICNNALPQEDQTNIVLEYLSEMKVNSIGQIINYKEDAIISEDNNNHHISSTIINDNNNNNVIYYPLWLSVLFFIISLTVYFTNLNLSYICIYAGLFSTILWFHLAKK